jgi:hypothetical protein
MANLTSAQKTMLVRILRQTDKPVFAAFENGTVRVLRRHEFIEKRDEIIPIWSQRPAWRLTEKGRAIAALCAAEIAP